MYLLDTRAVIWKIKMRRLDNIKLFVFDLGGTLMEYKGMHLSWTGYYKNAFEYVNEQFGLDLSEMQIADSIHIFCDYNPAVNPREKKIEPEIIFSDIIKRWGTTLSVSKIIEAFFESLKLEPVIYEDSIPTLDYLKKSGFKIATMTDVATGMPDIMHKNYVTPLLPYFDLYVSSLSCGYKKPNPKGLRDISEQFGIASENMVMIGDTSRDVNAAKNFGCRSILINRNDDPSQKLGQNFTIKNTQEIIELIQIYPRQHPLQQCASLQLQEF